MTTRLVLRPRAVRAASATVIGLLVAAILATQAIRLGTGSDLLFGAIPAFDPAGIRNVPIYAAGVALAFSALWTAIAAAATGARKASGAAAWWLFSASQALLVLLRMAFGPMRGWEDPRGPAGSSAAIVAMGEGAAVVLAMALCVWAGMPRAHFRTRRLLAIGTVLFAAGATAAFAVRHPGLPLIPGSLSYVLLATAGRIAELAAVGVFISATCAHLIAMGPQLQITLDSRAPRLAAARETTDGVALDVSPRRLRWAMVGVSVALLAASLVASFGRFNGYEWSHEAWRAFWLDNEGNVPSTWSALLLLSGGGASTLLAWAARARHDRWWPYWATLALLFVALSADEYSVLHERLYRPLQSIAESNWWFRHPVIIPGAIVCVTVTIAFWRFSRTLGATTRRRLIAGAVVFVLGAFIVETAAGWYAPFVVGENVPYVVLTTIEETLEMVGVAMVVVALLEHAGREVGPLEVDLRGNERAAARERVVA